MPKNKNGGRNNHQNQRKIPEDVNSFAGATFKKFKKENKNLYDSKKEMKRDYYTGLFMMLPDVVDWTLRDGNAPMMKEYKDGIYEKFAGADGPELVKYLLKHIEVYGKGDIENLALLPIIIGEIIREIMVYNEGHPNDAVKSPDELFELANVILKKKLKKAVKRGLSENFAFDALTIIPCKEAMDQRYHPVNRLRDLFSLIYYYAEKENIEFYTIVKLLFDEDDYGTIIKFALLEKKDKTRGFNPSQMTVFNSINSWLFAELEEMEHMDIVNILKEYVRIRRNDERQNRDGERRYYISSLPESKFPHIKSAVDHVLKQDQGASKYL